MTFFHSSSSNIQNPEEHWGVSVCFRGVGEKESPEANEGWPLGDVPACEFLSSPSIPNEIRRRSSRLLKVFQLNQIAWGVDTLLQGEEIAAAFIGALFRVLHETIVDARRGRSKQEAKKVFDNSWSVPDVTRPAKSLRNDNFQKVRIKANLLLVSHGKEMSEAWNPKTR